MSGGGVFAHGLLIGVLIIDEPGYPATRLSAIPIHSLASEPRFWALVHGPTAARPAVASVELDPLFSPTWPRRRRRVSVASLLRADAEVVPFRGREDELADLAQWCDSAEEFDVRLLVGPGGQGKTRLGRQLVHLRPGVGWAAGFLAADPPGQPLDLTAIADTATPTLLVVDYAETRTDQLARLLHTLEDAADVGPVRILLLARSAGQWWDKLRQRHSGMLGTASVSVLPTLDDSLAARQDAFDNAIESFAQALSEADPDTNWQDLTDSVTAPEDIDAERYGTPLTLQMTALITLLDNRLPGAARPDVTTDAAPVALEQQILDHEQRYWEETAADHNLVPRQILFAPAAALRREAVASVGRCRARACGGPARVPRQPHAPRRPACPRGPGPPCLTLSRTAAVPPVPLGAARCSIDAVCSGWRAAGRAAEEDQPGDAGHRCGTAGGANPACRRHLDPPHWGPLSLTVAATVLLGAGGSDEAMASLARLMPWLTEASRRAER